MCQTSSLAKSRVHVRDLEDQARDTAEAIRQHRCARERAEKSAEELRIALDAAQEDLRKKDRFYVEWYDFSQKMSVQNKDLWALISSMTEELGMAHRSYEVTKERAVKLEKTVASLQGELALAREKLSEVDRLRAERARLSALCDELEEEVRRGAE